MNSSLQSTQSIVDNWVAGYSNSMQGIEVRFFALSITYIHGCKINLSEYQRVFSKFYVGSKTLLMQHHAVSIKSHRVYISMSGKNKFHLNHGISLKNLSLFYERTPPTPPPPPPPPPPHTHTHTHTQIKKTSLWSCYTNADLSLIRNPEIYLN